MTKRAFESLEEYKASRRVGGSRYKIRTAEQNAKRRERHKLNPLTYSVEQLAKHAEAVRKHRLKHPERALEQSRASHAKFKDRERLQTKAWRESHRGYIARKNAEWRIAHPEYVATWWRKHPAKRVAKTARRRALKFMQRCGCCTNAQIEAVYATAALIGGEVDHRIPLTLGGHHCIKNLQALTYDDHQKKTSLDLRSIAMAKRISQLLRRWPRFSGESSSLSM